MNKKFKLSLTAIFILSNTSVFATNGDLMIGQGAKSRSMGGVGIAKSFGAESALANPAGISSVKDSEVSAGATIFMPNVEFKSNAGSQAQGHPNPKYAKSASDMSVIPELYYASRINDNMVYGLTLAGIAGMGVDYSSVPFGKQGDNGAFQMKTELALLKIALPFSYTKNGLSVGVAPVLQYGTLQMSHQRQTQSGFAVLSSPKSSSTGVGYELGATYDISSSLTIGTVYKSEIAMTYKSTIGTSIGAFGGVQTGITSGDVLDQPAEYGAGVSYAMGDNTIALDYKNIAWSSASGYKDFGWEDQDVFALGYEYKASNWYVRTGYNQASSPITEQNNKTNPYSASVKNFFNLSGFPGMVESHYTVGGGYSVSKALDVDFAVVYANENENSFTTAGMTQAFIAGAGGQPTGKENSTADVKHSQLGITIAATYRY